VAPSSWPARRVPRDYFRRLRSLSLPSVPPPVLSAPLRSCALPVPLRARRTPPLHAFEFAGSRRQAMAEASGVLCLCSPRGCSVLGRRMERDGGEGGSVSALPPPPVLPCSDVSSPAPGAADCLKQERPSIWRRGETKGSTRGVEREAKRWRRGSRDGGGRGVAAAAVDRLASAALLHPSAQWAKERATPASAAGRYEQTRTGVPNVQNEGHHAGISCIRLRMAARVLPPPFGLTPLRSPRSLSLSAFGAGCA
jgi:hypothetical protein